MALFLTKISWKIILTGDLFKDILILYSSYFYDPFIIEKSYKSKYFECILNDLLK